MSQVSLDSGEMKDFLHHIISNNRHIQEKGLRPVATEIIGESGLGKTTVALDVAASHKLDLVKLNLAQIEELGDLVGYPVRQFEVCRKTTKAVSAAAGEAKYEMQPKVIGGKKIMQKVLISGDPNPVGEATNSECIWMDENAVDQYLKQGYEFTGNKRMSYCPPEWIADKKGGGILILDDWNRADIRFIQAVMELK